MFIEVHIKDLLDVLVKTTYPGLQDRMDEFWAKQEVKWDVEHLELAADNEEFTYDY